jgi:class 3 adenylate cyclase
MESTAPAGGIQISSETAKLISGRYILEPRGEIRAKGKGMLKTWIVQGAMKSDLNNEPQQYDKIA